jgi:hypothetical protein
VQPDDLPTPRTDALIATLDANHEIAIAFVWRRMVNHARSLERENKAIRTALYLIVEYEDKYQQNVGRSNCGSRLAEIARAALRPTQGEQDVS